MIGFQLWLRQFVEAKLTREFAKFTGVKLGLTVVSFGSLWLWSLSYPNAVDQVTLVNSALTQFTEFFLLPKYVFTKRGGSQTLTRAQFIKFWIVVALLGLLEGYLMEKYLGLLYPFYVAYFYAHVPTFPLRFILDRYWVYREALRPGSK